MQELNMQGPEEAYQSLGEVIELISGIIESSELFRHRIEKAYDNVELAFLKRLLNAITLVEHDAIILKEDFIHMQQNLDKS
ncbi:hypothetical protein HZI73_23670 [Vallitalea pronyensis]|uniref:Uncharacterized protein n=1 Tax=Vallitalea pronyensis TaxID=1348613 RepID=A0A8J8MNQ7_9FIRM|nr:hypothetical protein [Vallitalea pronyensis]QUI25110.1 hypothetical protein HZI73_23670 [Vallitalea pronyensis]